MISDFFKGYDTREDYTGLLMAAAFVFGFLALLVYLQREDLPARWSDLLSGEFLPLLVSTGVLCGSACLLVLAALVRRARDAGFPVLVAPAMQVLLVPLALLSRGDLISGRVPLMLANAAFLLDLLLLLALAGLLGIVDRLDISGAPPAQPEHPPVARSGFSALAERQGERH